MKTKLLRFRKGLFLCFLFSILSIGYVIGQDSDMNLAEKIKTDISNQMRSDIEAEILEKGSARLELFASTQEAKGHFMNELLIPIIQDLEGKLNYKVYYLLAEETNENASSPEYIEELRRIKTLIAIEQLYPNKYLDYLLAMSKNSFQGDWRDLAKNLKIDTKAVVTYAKGQDVSTIITQHRTEATKNKINRIDLPVFRINKILWAPDLEKVFAEGTCCDFYRCYYNCAFGELFDNFSEFSKTIVDLSKDCLGDAKCIWELFWGIVNITADIVECFDECVDNPCSHDGSISCPPGTYCDSKLVISPHPVFPGNPFLSEHIIASSCEDCPKLFSAPTGTASSIVGVQIPEKKGFYIGQLIPSSDPWYNLRLIRKRLNEGVELVDVKISQAKFSFFNINDYDPKIGDEFCLYFEGLDEFAQCANRKICFKIACPEVELDVVDGKLELNITQDGPYNFYVKFRDVYQSGVGPVTAGLVGNTNGTYKKRYNIPLLEDAEYCIEISVSTDFNDNERVEECNVPYQVCKTITECDIPEEIFKVNTTLVNAETSPGTNTGSLNILATGGYPPYTYKWDNGVIGTYNPNLGAGFHCVTVTDSKDCEIKDCFVVGLACSNKSLCPSLGLTYTLTPPSHAYTRNGMVRIASSLSNNLVFYWDDLSGSTTNPQRDGLAPGEYCVDVYDENCCHGRLCIAVEANCDLDIEINDVYPCLGSTGSIDITPLGGQPPYSFNWSNGSNQEDLDNLPYGAYYLTLSDANGCALKRNVQFAEPQTNLNYVKTITDACPGSSDGEIKLFPFGGFPPYTVSWSSGTVGTVLTGGAGTYYFSIVDSEGCSLGGQVKLEEGPEMEVIPTFRAACSGSSDGFAYVDVSGGTPPYTYLWNTGASAAYIIAGEGLYHVDIEDAKGCTKRVDFDLNYQQIDYSLTTNHASLQCDNGTGSVDVEMSGGSAPFQIDIVGVGSFTSYNNLLTIDGLTKGDYSGTISDHCGGSTPIEFSIFWITNPSPFLPFLVPTGATSCEGTELLGAIDLSVFGSSGPFTYLWSTGATTEDIEDLPIGTYYVTITNENGCELWEEATVTEAQGNNSFHVGIGASKTISCEGSPLPTGAVHLNVDGVGPFTYLWSTGATTEDIEGLYEGIYSVTVTNGTGCVIVREAEVLSYTLFPFSLSHDIEHACGMNNGSIDIEIENPQSQSYTYSWDNGETTPMISGLSAGTYELTVTSNLGCEKIESFEVEGEEGEFDYDVEVRRHFRIAPIGSGYATVYISSEIFAYPGTIQIHESNQNTWVGTSTSSPISGAEFDIPGIYAGINTFHFTYTSDNGCEYHGEFGGIPTCSFPDDFRFEPILLGDESDGCTVDQNHTYLIQTTNVGDNPPYFIKVTMLDPYDESEADYEEVFTYTGDPFHITGIPAGRVEFKSFSNCDGNILKKRHNNCCFDLSCDVIREGPLDIHDGSYFYEFQYFKIYANELCLDTDCGGLGNDPSCSSVVVELNEHLPVTNCWTGTIEVGFDDGTTAMFEVLESGAVEWLPGEKEWHPQEEQTYFLPITYTGTGESSGEDCSTELEVSFYGDTNANNSIGFKTGFWWSYNGPSEFRDAYFGAYRCKNCQYGEDYIFQEDWCEGYDNWLFTYFHFEPANYDDPCNGGGMLTIMDYDDNGNPIVQEVEIPADVSEGELAGEQPFIVVNTDLWCGESGWCLFDAIHAYGESFDKPLLATWAKPETCEVIDWPDLDTPNPNPSCTEGSCPDGYSCVNGNCYQDCNGDDDCLTGSCENGICVGDAECEPICPAGYDCQNGACYLEKDICDFYIEVNGGSGSNIYNFWHEEPAGTPFYFSYNTLSFADEIFITIDDNTTHIACVPTMGWVNDMPFVLTGNTVTIEVRTCQNGSRYHFEGSCTLERPGLNDPSNVAALREQEVLTEEPGLGLTVYPNPFRGDFEVIANNPEEVFTGEVLLLDNFGKTVAYKKARLEEGVNNLSVGDLENLANGMYILLIKKEGELFASKRLVKVD